MQLPPIPLDPPVVLPAVAEQQFDRLFMTDLNLSSAPNSAQVSAYLRLQPVNNSGQTTQTGAESYSIANLYEAATEVPSVAQAMGAVIACIPDLRTWAKSKLS